MLISAHRHWTASGREGAALRKTLLLLSWINGEQRLFSLLPLSKSASSSLMFPQSNGQIKRHFYRIEVFEALSAFSVLFRLNVVVKGPNTCWAVNKQTIIIICCWSQVAGRSSSGGRQCDPAPTPHTQPQDHSQPLPEALRSEQEPAKLKCSSELKPSTAVKRDARRQVLHHYCCR